MADITILTINLSLVFIISESACCRSLPCILTTLSYCEPQPIEVDQLKEEIEAMFFRRNHI